MLEFVVVVTSFALLATLLVMVNAHLKVHGPLRDTLPLRWRAGPPGAMDEELAFEPQAGGGSRGRWLGLPVVIDRLQCMAIEAPDRLGLELEVSDRTGHDGPAEPPATALVVRQASAIAFEHRYDLPAGQALGPALACLKPALRRALLDAAHWRPSIARGRIQAKVPARDETSRWDCLRALHAIASAAEPAPEDVPAAIARNIASESDPAWVERCLRHLCETEAKSPVTRSAIDAAIASPHPEVRVIAARFAPDRAPEILASVVRSARGNDRAQREALTALVRDHPEPAARELRGFLQRSPWWLQRLALEVVAEQRMPGLNPEIVRLLRSGSDEVVLAAARALSATGTGEHASALERLLRSASATHRLAGVQALAKIGTVAQVEALLELARGRGKVSVAALVAARTIQERAGAPDGGRVTLAGSAHGTDGALSVSSGEGGELSVAGPAAKTREALPEPLLRVAPDEEVDPVRDDPRGPRGREQA